MLKTLGAQIKEFKKDSFLTPVFMILEVLMETIIPLMMASIIDNGDQINRSKSCIDEKCHDHCADQRDRCADAHAQKHLICVLQVGHVGGKTGDKTCGAEFVNVGKRKSLYIFIHCFS